MHSSRLGSTSSPAARPAHASDVSQFMPFSALNGYYDLVREQERTAEPRHAMTEERAERISRMLCASAPREMSSPLVHYAHSAYVTTSGVVRQVDATFRTLELAGRGAAPGPRILFEDIWELDWQR